MAFAPNDKIKALTPYDPICGQYPIRLDANESYIPFPDEIRAEMERALADVALNRYPDPYAEKVCSLFAAFMGSRLHLSRRATARTSSFPSL